MGSPKVTGSIRVAVICFLLTVFAAARARASDQPPDPKQKATTAYGLGRYAEAAQLFESAFEAEGEPALLYNAAQSYRLAGNKERAVTLYRNYLHLYARGETRTQLEARIVELEKAIASEKAAQPPSKESEKPPVGATPVPATPVTSTPSPPEPAAAPPAIEPQPAAAPPPVLVDQPGAAASVEHQDSSPDRSETKPFYKKAWFWVAAGALVVGGATAAFLLSRGGAASPCPDCNLPTTSVNQ
jgi:tetratricopeptide (TPR) repeat protein